MVSEEIKPCIWCRSDRITLKQNMELEGITFFICENCGAVTSFMNVWTKAEAIERYNQRGTGLL